MGTHAVRVTVGRLLPGPVRAEQDEESSSSSSAPSKQVLTLRKDSDVSELGRLMADWLLAGETEVLAKSVGIGAADRLLQGVKCAQQILEDEEKGQGGEDGTCSRLAVAYA